jgi:hypothetical protein
LLKLILSLLFIFNYFLMNYLFTISLDNVWFLYFQITPCLFIYAISDILKAKKENKILWISIFLCIPFAYLTKDILFASKNFWIVSISLLLLGQLINQSYFHRMIKKIGLFQAMNISTLLGRFIEELTVNLFIFNSFNGKYFINQILVQIILIFLINFLFIKTIKKLKIKI